MPNLTRDQIENGMKSLSGHIANLEVGESHALATKMHDGALCAEIDEALEELSNRGRSGIARAKHSTKHGYRGEQGSFRAAKTGETIVCFVITRAE